MELLAYGAVAALAYLLGSIPTGYLVARRNRSIDLLRQGSGRTGATNVLRTMGWKAAGIVFAGDLLKGMMAVVAARLVTQGDPTADLVAGLAVIAGHNYSLFLRFRGGRGVVAGLGSLAVISPLTVGVAAAVGIVIIGVTRYVSLGSILGSALAPVVLTVLVLAAGQPAPHLLYGVVGATLVILSHRDNISRLLNGTERRLGERLNSH